jgi:hypothetical protein
LAVPDVRDDAEAAMRRLPHDDEARRVGFATRLLLVLRGGG